ncbi:hypothetical protein D9613_007096 [Agrocybe pediades]|uniref:Wings apart-like protein C-terminal domain-containing protein n=1 Tax=Agrocybe pediades TaxID=84607 RepID=A0A8H4QGW9_9AGAR|nr:hypothetical protein D9613_007096 [Agrocybe pediades]
MSTAGTSSLPRTYGKRAAMKRKSTKEASELADETSVTPATPIKRRKLSPSPVQRIPSPTRTESVDSSHSGKRSPEEKANGSLKNPTPQPSPSKPSKPIRDLSSIFDDIIPSKSPAPSPSKLAKRMLARSKTESSIESQSGNHGDTFTLERTPSLPNLPPSPSKPSKSPTVSRSLTTSVIPTLPASKKTVTRTYAGSYRSFLVPLPSSSKDPLAATMEEDELDARESYSSLRNRWGVDNSEDDPYPILSPSPTKSNVSTPSPSRLRKGKSKDGTTGVRPLDLVNMNALKSISELRNKGESRRFLDEVGYLFEGMDSTGAIALRRASALEITTKLCDQDFYRKAKAADFFTKTWDMFIDAGAGRGEDKLLDILLLFFIALVARDADSLAELAERSAASSPTASQVIHKATATDEEGRSTAFIDILFRFLDAFPSDKDPIKASAVGQVGDAELKKVGISKKDRTMLSTVYKIISSKSDLFPDTTPISISLLVSCTLQTLSPSMIPTTYFPTFLRSFKSTMAIKSPSTLSQSLSLHWTDTATSLPYENLSYHLRLLDAFLLDQWDSSALNNVQSQEMENNDMKAKNDEALSQARDEWLADDLVALGVCIELNAKTDDSEYPQQCLAAILRILVSLTHADERWGRKVVQCEYTMGWLFRLIHRTGQEVQRSRPENSSPHKKTKSMKDEEDSDADDLLLKNDDVPPDQSGDYGALDTLCLALGLLTNLVQVVDVAKRSVRETRLNPSCILKKRICGQRCSCSSTQQQQSGIQILAPLYAQQQVKAESSTPLGTAVQEDSPAARAEADASFLRGHLAVLFGLLMMNCPENQPVVLSALPSSPSASSSSSFSQANRVKLVKLVEHAKDFAAFYTAVSNKLGGEQDSKVAKEVVAFLEEQRDLCT